MTVSERSSMCELRKTRSIYDFDVHARTTVAPRSFSRSLFRSLSRQYRSVRAAGTDLPLRTLSATPLSQLSTQLLITLSITHM